MSALLTPTDPPRHRIVARAWSLLALLLLLVGALAVTRLLYEWRFPAWLWLGRPLPVVGVSLTIALALSLAGHRLWRLPGGVLVLLPLALNVLYLAQPSVDLAFSRVLLAGSLWLVAVLAVWRTMPTAADFRWRWVGPLLVAAGLAPVYLLTMSSAVGAADTFEFQVVAPQLGIAHPTGYPLYLLLGKLFSLLPVGTVAWRVNLASAVYAVLAAVVIFWLARRLLRQPLGALVGAVAWGVAPVVWSQAIIAEVYTLHALIVAVALWLMVALLDEADSSPSQSRRRGVALAFVIGLGLTNHLTTVFLIPPALLTALFLMRDARQGAIRPWSIDWRYLALVAAAFLLPLSLYLYLPLRWAAVNGEPMGLTRFVDWVAGGRFQGALQWMAWLRDPARWGIVGRLIRDAWGWFYLGWAALGFLFLVLRRGRMALVLALTAAGFTFYALNYYVPDLAVFLLPVHVVIAVCVAVGVGWLMAVQWLVAETRPIPFGVLAGLVFLLAAGPLVWRTAEGWPALDQSARDGGEPWARGVLARPLAEDGALLADSEKIAPLYYLQQIEGLRPDLDIMVLPDEAAYRAELDARTAAGQAVYLARFLPGLAGTYHLRSVGPLVQADLAPMAALPEGATLVDEQLGPLRLVGYRAEPVAAEDPAAAGITLYWTLARPLADGEELPVIFTRWSSDLYPLPAQPLAGRHAAGDSYPINAWRPGEIVADYHALPLPVFDCPNPEPGCVLDIWVGLGPRFAGEVDVVWTPVASVPVRPPAGLTAGQPQRAQVGAFLLDGAAVPPQARPGTSLTVGLSGWGDGHALPLTLRPLGLIDRPDGALERPIAPEISGPSQRFARAVDTAVEPAPYVLWVDAAPGEGAVCGWLAPVTTGCALGQVALSGAPLPEGATNFADRIALLEVDLPQTELAPGGQLALTLTWQGLAPLSENYTVFVQVLDARDRIVGQVDSWPVQGTFPTSQWTPGERVRDPYVVQLSEALPPGDYKLNIGLYLLGTLQRLAVIDASGAAVDDKAVIGGLTVVP
jgi:hypothetical protein